MARVQLKKFSPCSGRPKSLIAFPVQLNHDASCNAIAKDKIKTISNNIPDIPDIFIKYLDAINDTSSFNDLCDKFIEQMYEHVGSPGMTKVYKIKSGGVKRKQMLVDLLKTWKKELPEM